MDVTCSRCSTRYEFDESLVSNKGTTVKCTTCGNQFRVRRPEGAREFAGWTVRTTDGRELLFSAMRELQAAIVGREVAVDDVLIPNDGGEPRRLGRIEELKSFFEREPGPETATERRSRRLGAPEKERMPLSDVPSDRPPRSSGPGRDGPVPSRTGDTLKPPPSRPLYPEGMGPSTIPRPAKLPKEVSMAATEAGIGPGIDPYGKTQIPTSTPPIGTPYTPPPSYRRQPKPAVADADFDSMWSGSIGDESSGEDGPLETPSPSGPPAADEPPPEPPEAAPTLRRAVPESEPPSGPDDDAEPDEERRVSGMPPGFSRPPSEPPEISSIPPLTPSPSVARPSILRRSDPHTDPRFSGYGRGGRRPTFLRWIVGLVSLGMVALIGFTLLKKRVAGGPAPSAASAKPNDKIDKLLATGERALGEGDLELAKEQVVKASGIDETDPRVSAALARIAIVHADLAWLGVRLFDDEDPARGHAEKELQKRLRQADEAVALARRHGGDGSTAGYAVDVLRLRGKIADARKLVSKVDAADPDSGRALALLDLGEPKPSYGTLIDRLRAAARAEKKLGRSQALLVYALCRAGSKKIAGEELAKVAESGARALHEPLRKLWAATEERATTGDGGDDADGDTAADTKGDTKADGKSDGGAVPADYRAALRQAHAARKRGDLDRAEQLYLAALDKDPGNSEALSGLADVSKARGNAAGAASRYQEMLKQNPGYIPALLGLADVKWSSGDKAGALALYRQVVQNAPGTSYAERAQARIAAGAGTPATTAGAAPSTAPTASATPEASATPTSKPTAPPESSAPPPPTSKPVAPAPSVDVSDLPEYH